MQFPSLATLFQHIKTSWQRFPAASLLALICMITSIVFVERGEHGNTDNWILRIIITSALGVPLLLGLSIAGESYRWSAAKMWMFRGLGILALAGYYLTLTIGTNHESQKDVFRFVALVLAVHCGVAVAAYLKRRDESVVSFWEFNKILLAQWMVAAFYGIVLYVGISLAVLGIDQLFGLDWPWRIYLHLFTIIAAGFHPLYFLSQVPKDYELWEEDPSYTAAIRNLVKYILIPLTLLYLLILYAYIIKIGIEWAWPKGYVSSLSLGFSMVGILTYLLNYRLVESDDSTFLTWFRRWFFYLLSPVVPVLLLAVGRRISDYGFTEPRYLVATLGIWLLLTCVYFIISKKDDIRFIPLSLGIFAFLSVVGPWSATPVSCRSQLGELERLLTKKGLLVDGKARPGGGAVTPDENMQLYSLLNFLADRNGLKATQPWFGSELDSVFQDKTPRYEMPRIISEHLKLETAAPDVKSGSFSFSAITGSVPAKGYEKLFKVNIGAEEVQEFDSDSVKISIKNNAMLLMKTGSNEETFNLEPYLQKLIDKYADTFYYANIRDPAYASVRLTGKQKEILLVPDNTGYNIVQNKIHITQFTGTLLVKSLK